MRLLTSCALLALVLFTSAGALAQGEPPEAAAHAGPAPSADAVSDAGAPAPSATASAPAAPTTPAPETSPSVSPATGAPAPSADRGESRAPRTEPPPEMTLGVQLDFGYGARLGDSAAYDFEQKDSGGVAFGGGLWFSPSRLWSVGVSYRHYDLGRDTAGSNVDTLDIGRSLDLLWVGGRAYPWRNDHLGVYLMLGLGVGWQHAAATGTLASPDFVHPPTAFVCSASDGPGLARGGGAGLDVDLDRNFAFFTQLDTIAHRQSGEVIGDCVPGSGSVTTLGATMGLAYRFGFDDEPRRAARR